MHEYLLSFPGVKGSTEVTAHPAMVSMAPVADGRDSAMRSVHAKVAPSVGLKRSRRALRAPVRAERKKGREGTLIHLGVRG
jgi:hypothetical protein